MFNLDTLKKNINDKILFYILFIFIHKIIKTIKEKFIYIQ